MSVHKYETDAKRVAALKPNYPNRKTILKNLLKAARSKHNNKADAGFQVPQRPSKGRVRKAADYGNCPYCHGDFIKKRLSEHVKRCGNIPVIRATIQLKFLSNCMNLVCHEETSIATGRCLAHLSDDEISDIIKCDHLIILYANSETEKFVKKGH